jgi:Trk-type K+ transport system membrane component
MVSVDNVSVTTSLTAVISCFNNIGPGLEAVGPTCNYGGLSILSKLVLIFDMLAGRLEIFPLLLLFSRSTWNIQGQKLAIKNSLINIGNADNIDNIDTDPKD